MNVPFDPNTFILLLKSQFIFIDHLLHSRHFTISLVAFKGIGSGLHLPIYLTVLFVDVNPKCARMSSPCFAGLDHGICSWKILAPVPFVPFATWVTLGKMLQLSLFYSSDATRI